MRILEKGPGVAPVTNSILTNSPIPILCKRGTVEVAGFLKSHFRFFAILHTCVAISQNNAAPLNIIFELGADFGHLLFESYLVIE